MGVRRLPRVGPKTAFSLVDQCGSDPWALVKEARKRGINVPQGYLEEFQEAHRAFREQVVLDPESGRQLVACSQASQSSNVKHLTPRQGRVGRSRGVARFQPLEDVPD